MTIVEVRDWLSAKMNLTITDKLLSDSQITTSVNQVLGLFYSYKRQPAEIRYVEVVGGVYTFTVENPETICKVYTVPGPVLYKYTYAGQQLFVQPDGFYYVEFTVAQNLASLLKFPNWIFEDLLHGKLKQAVGQKVKFSKFSEQPFEIDGEGLYSEGTELFDTMKEFLIINRDV